MFVIPLIGNGIDLAADKDIWRAVIALVSLQAAPPTIFDKAALDTPLKSASSSQQGSEQIQEINDCVYQNTEGFYEKYFEGRSWSAAVEKIVRAINPQIVDGRWTEYPNPPKQEAFLDWFWTFQDRSFQGTGGVIISQQIIGWLRLEAPARSLSNQAL